MPSYEKPDVPNMSDVFKTHPNSHVVSELLAKYRALAKRHIQETMPQKILHIQRLLESENDPSSPLWTGHIDTEAYKPKMFQPTDPEARSRVGGREIVLPSEVVRGAGDKEAHEDGGELPGGGEGANGLEVGDGLVRGVRTGPHWFEVVPINKVQNELLALSNKEYLDMHLICQDLRIWLELEIPLIEDGNSFGADVQAHIIRELNEMYKRSNSFQNGCRAHNVDRLKLAAEWVKYPNFQDYPAAIALSDSFDHLLLRSYLRSALVTYGGLLTKFERNWAKVINPKGSNHDHERMY